MTLENANITVDKVEGTGTLAAITNNLVAIQGTGTIILNAKDTEYRTLLRGLVLGDGVTVDCVTVVPQEDIDGAVTNLTATVSQAFEDVEATKTVVGGMKTESGDVYIEVKSDATKDVVVQDGAEAKNNMTIINKSTLSLTVPEATAENVYIDNSGHLESNASANKDMNIYNGSANTVVGTYKAGGSICVWGEYGSLSNVTFDAKSLTLTGTNIVSGPVTLDANEVAARESTLLFSIEGGNGTCSINFGRVQTCKAFGVIVDDETTAGTYPLATNASVAAQILTLFNKNMSLVKDNSVLIEKLPINTNNLAIVGGMACGLTLTNGELKAVVKIVADYTTSISNTAARACEAILAMPRLTDAEKTTATNAVMSICADQVKAVIDAPDTDTAEKAVAKAESDIADAQQAAKDLGDNKPYSITIDATAVADGTNVFNTLDAAFKSVDTQFATNLVIKGNVGLSADVSAAPATNALVTIEGVGAIIIDYTRGVPRTKALLDTFKEKVVEGEEVAVKSALPTVELENLTLTTKYAAQWITLSGENTIEKGAELVAPAVTNLGTLAWDLRGDNHDATLTNFDYITEGPDAAFEIQLDGDQRTGDTITNYVIATGAASATNLTFTIKGFATDESLKVGAENTLYVGAKAFSLVVDANSNLVFDVAWGKFAITYDAMGGAWSDGAATSNVETYVNTGYVFPANPKCNGYGFTGWYTNVTCEGEAIAAGDALVELAEHTLYAGWENAFTFEATQYSVPEGGAVTVRVWGGNEDAKSQVTLSCVSGTGTYKAAYLNGKKVTLPLTLSWDKGKFYAKEILFRTETAATAFKRTFALQLGSAVGEPTCPGRDVCTVTITNAGGTGRNHRYVRALAYPANGGTVTGGGLAPVGSRVRIEAAPKNGSLFAGWYRAMPDDENAINLDDCIGDQLVRNIKNPGTYFAYFTNVLEVAEVAVPDAYAEGATGVIQSGSTYTGMVGVKLALPCTCSDGTLKVTSRPAGISWNSAKGVLSGVPTTAGTYRMTFKATNAAGVHTVHYTITVKPLAAQAVGTWTGVIRRNFFECGIGAVTFTAGSTGKLSAKVTTQYAGTQSFSATGYDFVDEDTLAVNLANKDGVTLTAELDLTADWGEVQLTGSYDVSGSKTWADYDESGTFELVRNPYDASTGSTAARQLLAGYLGTWADDLYNEDGTKKGTASFKVRSTGNVVVAGTYGSKSFSGTVKGGLKVWEDGTGTIETALRNGNRIWSADATLDSVTRELEGEARYISGSSTDVVLEMSR